MGQIKIRGTAKKKYIADLMGVNITISTDGETAAYAIKKGKKEVEKVLKLLVELGADLSKVVMTNENVSEPSRYSHDEFYTFQKSISFMSKADLGLLERLSIGIIQREIDATYREHFCHSNAEEISKEVLQEALVDSRKKAEAIAESLGQKIVGIETAKCDEYCEDEDSLCDTSYKLFPCSIDDDEFGSGLATQLSPGKISIERTIDVAWIVE